MFYTPLEWSRNSTGYRLVEFSEPHPVGHTATAEPGRYVVPCQNTNGDLVLPVAGLDLFPRFAAICEPRDVVEFARSYGVLGVPHYVDRVDGGWAAGEPLALWMREAREMRSLLRLIATRGEWPDWAGERIVDYGGRIILAAEPGSDEAISILQAPTLIAALWGQVGIAYHYHEQLAWKECEHTGCGVWFATGRRLGALKRTAKYCCNQHAQRAAWARRGKRA